MGKRSFGNSQFSYFNTSSSTSFKKIYSEHSHCLSNPNSKTDNSSLNDAKKTNDVKKYDEEPNECYLFVYFVIV